MISSLEGEFAFSSERDTIDAVVRSRAGTKLLSGASTLPEAFDWVKKGLAFQHIELAESEIQFLGPWVNANDSWKRRVFK